MGAGAEVSRLKYFDDLHRLLAWWVNHYGASRALELNVLTLREARERLRRGRTNATANLYLSAMRSAWNWARAAGLIPNDQLWPQRLMLTEPRGRTRFLSDAELERLLAAAGRHSPRMLAAITLSVATGLRQGELLRLDWSDIDFAKRTVRVRHSKNDDPRTVHLPDSAAEALQALKRSSKVLGAAVFATATGARFIGAVLGHRSPSVTVRYAHMVQGAPVTGHDKVDARLRGAAAKTPA